MEYHLTSATCNNKEWALIELFAPGLTYMIKDGKTTLQSGISRAGEAEETSDNLWKPLMFWQG